MTSVGGLSANDTIVWSQLGADATDLTATPSFTSTNGLTGSVTLAGPHSLVAVVCPETLCSWNLDGLTGFSAGDSLIWTADTGNSGNGPLTLNFTSKNVSGAGAVIQSDGPAQFTASIQAFDGGTSLGSFPVTSDVNGDATFIGVLDTTAANITKVTFSLTSCSGDCSDFAIDTVSLNVPGGATPTATATATPTRHSDADQNCNRYCDRERHSNSFGDRDQDCYGDGDCDRDRSNFHRDPDRDPDSNGDGNGHFNCDSDPHSHARRGTDPRK